MTRSTWTSDELMYKLSLLDFSIHTPAEIVLAGGAVPVLEGVKYSGSEYPCFAVYPGSEVMAAICTEPKLLNYFDTVQNRFFGLLSDFMDRVKPVYVPKAAILTVRRLSLMDWVVSRLACPDLNQVCGVEEVTLAMLKEIESKMEMYTGPDSLKAARDLEYLISVKER